MYHFFQGARFLVVIVFFCISMILVTPEFSSSTSLHKFLADLVEQHDRIHVSAYRLEAAGKEVGQSRSGLYPALDLTANTGYESIDREYGADTDKWRYRATLTATQLITDFGRTRAGVGRALAVEERALANWQMVKLDVLLEGATAYLNLVRARERLDPARQTVVGLRKQVSVEESLRDQGAGLASDVLQAQAQLAGAQAVAETFEGERLMASNRFLNVFHTLPDSKEVSSMTLPLYIEDSLPESFSEALTTGEANSFLLALAKQEVDVSEQELKVQERSLWPRVQLFAKGDPRRNDDGTPGDRTSVSAGIKLTSNLFRGYGDEKKIAAARSRLRAAKSNLAYVRRQVEEQVHNGWDGYLVAGKRARLLQEQTDDLEEFLRLAKKERIMGIRSLLDVLNGEMAVLGAQSSAVSARVDRIIQACSLLHAMGALTVDTFRPGTAAKKATK